MATGADADGQGTSLLAAAWSDAGASVQHRCGDFWEYNDIGQDLTPTKCLALDHKAVFKENTLLN